MCACVRRPRHMRIISFRYAVNGPTKPQEALSNHEAEYFRQSQASLFWPMTAAPAYRPISLLDTIGKSFERIPLARILQEVSEHGVFRDEQFGFRPKRSTSLQLARHVERVTRNFGERRLTGAIFLDVPKALDTVWVDGLVYKLTSLNFPSYLVKIITFYLSGRTFEASFQTATDSRRGMLACMSMTCPSPPATWSWLSTRMTRLSLPSLASES